MAPYAGVPRSGETRNLGRRTPRSHEPSGATWALDAERFHARGEGICVEPQALGGAARAGNLPVHGLQRAQHVAALEIAHLGQRQDGFGVRGGRRACGRCDPRQWGLGQCPAKIQASVIRGDERAFDHVLQLAHVARPVVPAQLGLVVLGESGLGAARLSGKAFGEGLGE